MECTEKTNGATILQNARIAVASFFGVLFLLFMAFPILGYSIIFFNSANSFLILFVISCVASMFVYAGGMLDATKGLDLKIKYKTFIRGDERITSIAAASIIAKVTRDLFMIKLAKKYPKYSWNKNFGYGTDDHLRGLKKYGVTKHHRKKFSPVHKMLISKTRETQ